MLPKDAAVLALGLLAACSGAPKEEPARPDATGGVLILEQAYDVPAADAWKAAGAALEEGEFTIERRRRDDCGGKIVARREDGHRVTVTIHAPQRSTAEVTVVVDPADRQLLDTIQKRIGEKLSLKKARSDLLADTVLEASYEADVDRVIAAAERACSALSLEIDLVRRDQGRARLEARGRDNRVVRVGLRQADGGTQVVLSTQETGAGEKDFLRRFRRELERHLFPSSE
jgi:hypothetical protein